jgi:hypothetical protein
MHLHKRTRQHPTLELSQRRTLVHCNVIRLVALDLVLRFVVTCMNLVAFELDLGRFEACTERIGFSVIRVITKS